MSILTTISQTGEDTKITQKHHQGAFGATQQWQFKLTNLDSVYEVCLIPMLLPPETAKGITWTVLQQASIYRNTP
jgi:hypothetical protein